MAHAVCWCVWEKAIGRARLPSIVVVLGLFAKLFCVVGGGCPSDTRGRVAGGRGGGERGRLDRIWGAGRLGGGVSADGGVVVIGGAGGGRYVLG